MAELCIRYLLANPNATDLDKFMDYSALFWQTHFCHANYHENDETVLLAISICEEIFETWVDMRDEWPLVREQTTPLLMASSFGLKALVRRLLQNGEGDLDSKNALGRTSLTLAALNGHKAIVKLLLETGEMDVDNKDCENETPLSWAARHGHNGLVRLLLENRKSGCEQQRPFWPNTTLIGLDV